MHGLLFGLQKLAHIFLNESCMEMAVHRKTFSFLKKIKWEASIKYKNMKQNIVAFYTKPNFISY